MPATSAFAQCEKQFFARLHDFGYEVIRGSTSYGASVSELSSPRVRIER